MFWEEMILIIIISYIKQKFVLQTPCPHCYWYVSILSFDFRFVKRMAGWNVIFSQSYKHCIRIVFRYNMSDIIRYLFLCRTIRTVKSVILSYHETRRNSYNIPFSKFSLTSFSFNFVDMLTILLLVIINS